jgi:hypothetical protein
MILSIVLWGFMDSWNLSNDFFNFFVMWRFHSVTPCIFVSCQVDDILETKLDRKFKIITDKGTLDAIGLHPDGPAKRYSCDMD